jgi:hypothetical protein
MYENIFTYNFISNFFFSLLFLIINIFFSIIVANNSRIKKIFFFKEFQPIIVFYLIFCIYIFFFNLTIIFNYKLISEIFFIIFFLQIIFVFFNIKDYKFFYNFGSKIDEIFILLVFFSLFLISLLPISDADSIAYISSLPATIFNEGLKEINLNQNLEFTLLSNTEVILLISSILKSDNFGSQLNFITLFFFIIINFKTHKNFSLIIFSSPLIIYFISAQKLQLFFSVLFLLSFILINKDLLKKKIELFIFILLLTFYSSGKLSYILLTIPLFLYFFYINFKEWRKISIYLLASFLIVYLPLLILKQNYFANIVAPFFDNFFGQSVEAYNAQAYALRSTMGWLTNPGDFLLYTRPFLSLNLHELSSSLGLVFLIMLINLKLLKQTKYLPLVLIILVLATGQILPRYYFEAFLLLAYLYKPERLIVKLFIYSQVSIIFLISLIYIYFAYVKYDVIYDKEKYMNKFSYSFYNYNQLKKDNLGGNVLDYSLDRHSIFFSKNIYSTRYLDILDNFDNDSKKLPNLNKFILDNSIEYLIILPNYKLPNCLKTEKIKETYRIIALRNFLIDSKKDMYNVLKIKNNDCINSNK